MRETRSSSASLSIETEAASIEISPLSTIGIACTTVMSSSISSSGRDSHTIARDAGRSCLETAADLEAADAAGLEAADAAGLEAADAAGLEAADAAGLE